LRQLFYRDEKAAMKPWVNYLGLALIAVQGLAVLRLLDRFKLENEAFRVAAFIAFGGFIVHHLLPMRFRLKFFLALSLGITAYILGLGHDGFHLVTSLQRTGILVVLGGILIAVCHLPFSFGIRVGILVAIGAVLVVFRAGWAQLAVLGPVWPVFGAMFMFRLAIYIYDIQHEKERPPLARTLSYFFMLPNVALTLFPVVDYKTFAKNYYNEETFQAYQRGITWMARGVIQLILWRLIYYHIYLGPAQVDDGTELVRFMLSNVLLYLRVPGEFHFVIGLLTLFGFNLPETNKKFFFADSFLDYWRRVNIYWKDFMMKMVFYPIIFRMKTWNQTTAMIVATALAFVVTWALHSYQWFWLRGTFPVITQDIIFWSILGVLVIVNSVVEQKTTKAKTIGAKTITIKDRAINAAKIVAVFTTMTTLWSFWNCESVPQWLGLMKLADVWTFIWFAVANAVLVALKVIFDVFFTPAPPPKKKLGAAAAPKIIPIFPFKTAAMFVVLPLLSVSVVTSGRVVRRLGPEAEIIVASLGSTKPNTADQAQMERGYYDDLMDVSRFNAQLNESLTSQPADWKKLEDTDAQQPTNDHRINELVPSKHTIINEKRVTTNRWGMRDKDYELQKAPGTYRVAIIGSSHVMGWGVHDERMFEPLLEERLNRELAQKPWDKYEILNFGMNGYDPVAQITTVDKKVAPFKPDAVWMVSHANDGFWIMNRFARAVRKKTPPPYELMQKIQKEADLDEHTPDLHAQRKLTPYLKDILRWSYQEIADRSREMGAQPVWIFMPGVLERGELTEQAKELVQMAKNAGFVTMILPTSIYKNETADKLGVAPWDAHPNAYGHELLAEGIYERLMQTKELTLFSRTGTTETSTRAH
jgi:hypothetical protein